jgi:hypothetical protein
VLGRVRGLLSYSIRPVEMLANLVCYPEIPDNELRKSVGKGIAGYMFGASSRVVHRRPSQRVEVLGRVRGLLSYSIRPVEMLANLVCYPEIMDNELRKSVGKGIAGYMFGASSRVVHRRPSQRVEVLGRVRGVDVSNAWKRWMTGSTSFTGTGQQTNIPTDQPTKRFLLSREGY